jgi:predicted acyltransferase
MNPPFPEREPAPAPRLLSLDALRGFDMAFIVGLGGLFAALASLFKPPADQAAAHPNWAMDFAGQFEHVDWLGFHFEDLIFPLFVFIAGVSLTFSLARGVEQHGRDRTSWRLFRRCFVLFLLGVIYNGGFKAGWDPEGLEKVRWLGVLQRIALATLFAGLLHIWLRPHWLVLIFLGLLGGYWALFAYWGNGDYREGTNIVNMFDASWLPGHRYDQFQGHHHHDPEGILSTFPAIASALLGIFAGLWLRRDASGAVKTLVLATAGGVLLVAGWLWSPWDPATPMENMPWYQVPAIKKLWTPSFVLVAGGWSAGMLALFYFLIDVVGWRWLSLPWMWIGCNPITIYLLGSFLGYGALASRLTGPAKRLPDWLVWLPPAVAFAIVLLIARFLFKRRIFLRV